MGVDRSQWSFAGRDGTMKTCGSFWATDRGSGPPATQLSPAGHIVEVLTPDPVALTRFIRYVHRIHPVVALWQRSIWLVEHRSSRLPNWALRRLAPNPRASRRPFEVAEPAPLGEDSGRRAASRLRTHPRPFGPAAGVSLIAGPLAFPGLDELLLAHVSRDSGSLGGMMACSFISLAR